MGGGAGFGSVASPQQPERSPPTQPQNPYRSPTITNPYSPEDRRQFGFQIPHQLQMNQQRQQYQPPEQGMSYTGGSRDFYRDRGGFGGDPRSDVGTMGMQPQRQRSPFNPYMQQQQFNPYMQQQQFNPYMQQQRPNPYQMYGGLGSLFNMQDAYSQRPAPITQAQSNEANRKIQEKYKNPAQQTAQQAAQQYDFNPISINNVG